MFSTFSTPSFQGFSKLPPALVPSSIRLMKFAGAYMMVDGDARWFDWARFFMAVNNQDKKNLSIAKCNQQPISEGEASVGWMVDQIVKYLVNILSITVDDEFTNQLHATVGATFGNIKESGNHGFLDFNVSKTGTNSSLEYRVYFAIENSITPEQFHGVVCTIRLSAYVHEESEWWGLSHSTTKEFSAQITALELVVGKDFRI